MEDSRIGEGSQTFDEGMTIEPILPLRTQNPLEVEFASDMDVQMESLVPFQEESDKQLSSQPTSDGDSQPIEHIDVTDSFTTDMIFDSRQELVKWTQHIAKAIGMAVVISKSDMGGAGRIPRICFACERSGERRDKKQRFNKTNKTRQKRTKRCGCPFALKGIKLPKDDQWKVGVICGYHNHPITQHSSKLSWEEKKIVEQMVRSGVKPKDVVTYFKANVDSKNVKLRTIYNAKMQMKNSELSTKSQMQQLLKKLGEHKYMEWHRTHEDGDSVRDLFWAHPESVKLAKCFPSVFVMDCYKRNNYRPSLLEIVGVTSTNKTFSFAFAYLEAEREDNYAWALNCMKSVLTSESPPSIIVTHREVPLMNAISIVFPEARNFLCRDHISVDLVSNFKALFNSNEAWDAFISRWNNLVFSSTEEEYYERLSAFEGDLFEYPEVLDHVKNIWLSYKHCFIAAWTDQNLHFGNTTISRIDDDQARLKKHLASSLGNFNTVWTAINSLLSLQHSEIHASFKECLTTTLPNYTSPLFDELKRFVSIIALDLLLMEVKRADSIGAEDACACACAIGRTHGLPCAHEISKYKNDGQPIPISRIHSHWKKLSSVPTMSPQHELYYRPEIQLFINRFEEANENLKLELLNKLRKLVTSV